MRNSSDGLHLDSVHLLQRMVQNTRSVDSLESKIFVIEVADEQTLGSEGIWLNIDVGSGHTLQEARLSYIGVSADEESSGVGIDRGETAQMLSDLVEVEQWVFQATANSGHATQSGTLQLLALEQRLGVFEQSHIVARYGLDEVLGGGQLTQGNSEMVGIVESVEQILVERMDVLQSWEAVEDQRELL